MKIGIDIRTLMDARYSGVSEYTSNLVKEILKLDQENDYRLYYNSFTDVSPRLPRFNQSRVSLAVGSYPNKLLNYILFKFLNYPKIDRLLKADLFFMPHINFIALSGGCRGIIAVHDLSFLRYPEYFSRRKNFWHWMIRVKKLVSKFDTVVAVSENTKHDLIELCGLDPVRIKMIYSGVGEQYRPLVQDEPRLRQVKEKYRLPEKFILCLATIEPRKNIAGLISAYDYLRENNKNLADCKLIIAGGRGWKYNQIYKSWQEAKYRHDIKFLGYVDTEDKPCLYNLAELFVYPSFYEGFGFPPLEAMACGLPVVSSTTSSLSEVTGGAAVMVDPFNLPDLAEAMAQVLSDQELGGILKTRGLEQAAKFSWRNTAREYLNLFKTV